MSVSLLAASLPGGDPLAAALAAGETPSPELVAASGGSGTLRPQIVASCFAMTVALLGGVFYFSGMSHLVNLTLLEKPPEYLRERAKEVIHHLGYDQPPTDSAAGFRGDDFEFRYVVNVNSVSGNSANRRLTMFRDSPWHACQYWYRQSPKPLVSHEYLIRDRDSVRTRVKETTPPWTTSGMVGVRLDTAGYLRRFQAVPAKQLFAKPATSNPNWSMWFPESITSFDLTQLENADGEWITTPSTPFDALAAWEGKWPNSEEPLKVVAAAYRGRPVFFDVISPGAANPKLRSERYRGSEVLSLVLFGVVSVAAILTSFFHLRTGRGDKDGAVRIGIAVFTLELIAWMFNASHVTGQAEISLIQTAMGMASFRGGVAGLIYLAVEPLVRRDWPELLVSSSRLLRGRWSDPRIGRDLLLGTLVGIIHYDLTFVVPAHFDFATVLIGHFHVLSDSMCLVSELSGFCIRLVTDGLSLLFAMWLFHRLTRNKVATFTLIIGLGTAMIFTQVGMEPWQLPILLLEMALVVGLLVKYGILAWAWANLVWSVLQMPITTETEAFYFDQGLVAVGCVLAAATYGAYTSIRRDRTAVKMLSV
jgi:serine/threonine-protein kinase